ncbi:sodium-dependent glucose transporter 1A [Caerostris darwini]|uniref:Sodium-dependent glucose transporter 1A n=1 Tax=Caerostris darwini TaxID=1538125 RepID=A0AAV4RL07_9ARAC|nr:sodium-dependent glucose transporter 1A [Caerostris darwini]
MIAPLAISQYVKEKPQVLMYIVSGCVVTCGLLIFVLWVVTSRIGVKKPVKDFESKEHEPSDSSKFTVNRYSNEKEIPGDIIELMYLLLCKCRMDNFSFVTEMGIRPN